MNVKAKLTHTLHIHASTQFSALACLTFEKSPFPPFFLEQIARADLSDGLVLFSRE